MENDKIIEVQNVTVRFNMATENVDNLKEYIIKLLKRELLFKEFLALKNISLTVHRGEAWGIVGTNGSGKSTLLKLISGILTPYKGSVVVNGKIAPLIELGAGLDMNLTARENIYLDGCLLGHSRKFMEEHFDEIVDFAELWEFLDVPLKNYSSGMQARIGFAIATMVQPDILIVDEILSVGDYRFQQKCMKRMEEMLEKGATLLFVSHSIDDIRRMCDHAIWIDKGNTMMIGRAINVCDAYLSAQIETEDGVKFESPIWTKQNYLMMTYNSAIMHLLIYRSDDGINYKQIGKVNYKPESGNGTVRDPSFIKLGEFYYITYTAIAWEKGSYIGMCRTKLFAEFEELPRLEIGNFDKIWSPAFYEENGKVYLILNAGYEDAQKKEDVFQSYIVEYFPNSHSVGKITRIEGISNNVIDSRIYKIDGIYYLLYKNETSKYIELATSDKLRGPYKIAGTGDWAGWGNKLGGPSLTRTLNGNYRVIMENYTNGQLYYSESDTLVKGWSSLKKLSKDQISHAEIKRFDNDTKNVTWDL